MARYVNILAGVLWVSEFFYEIVGKILCKLYGAIREQEIIILTIHTQVIPMVWGSGRGSLAERAYLPTFEFHIFLLVHTGRSCQVGQWAKLATAHTAWTERLRHGFLFISPTAHSLSPGLWATSLDATLLHDASGGTWGTVTVMRAHCLKTFSATPLRIR